MLLIIDNESYFLKKLKKYLEGKKIEYRAFSNSEPLNLKELKNIKGVILSGGTGHPFGDMNIITNFVALKNFKVPTMGFCLGHEIIAAMHLGHINKLPEKRNETRKIKILKQDPIFSGLRDEVLIRQKHKYHVVSMPETFHILASSNICPIEAIKHKRKPIYGFQGHPEVSGEDGLKIIDNFLKICKI